MTRRQDRRWLVISAISVLAVLFGSAAQALDPPSKLDHASAPDIRAAEEFIEYRLRPEQKALLERLAKERGQTAVRHGFVAFVAQFLKDRQSLVVIDQRLIVLAHLSRQNAQLK